MLRGVYTAVSGMIAQQRKQEVLTHNLANIHTPGYKRDEAIYRSFPELLLERIRDPQTSVKGLPSVPGTPAPIGSLSHGVYTQELIPMFTAGDLMQTGNPLDVAIYDADLPANEVDGRMVKPALFFAVQTQDGEIRYTRHGSWTLDSANQLVTGNGHLVLDENNEPIQIMNQNFRITADGEILVPTDNPGEMEVVAQLQVVRADNPYNMVKEGDDLFRWEGEEALANAFIAEDTVYEIRQGYIERSNVDPVQTVTDMMTALRLYEANQKVVQSYDRTLEQLNQAGRI
ncbi:MAG: flagellar hook-basal body protein [Bacillaceae bacterium]|nr:flagellar hook-basal body protein [Bacillaceae bacterium]